MFSLLTMVWIFGILLVLYAAVTVYGKMAISKSRKKKPFKFPEFKNLLPPPKMRPPRESYKHKYEALEVLLQAYFDDLCERYSVKDINDMTCAYHKKLAKLIDYFEEVDNDGK